jgi:hypothetical protein
MWRLLSELVISFGGALMRATVRDRQSKVSLGAIAPVLRRGGQSNCAAIAPK